MTIGLGCMRLSTEAARDVDAGRAVIAAAIEAGVTLLDTADAYALDASEVGHNERLIADVLGARTDIEVVTKGGLVRPGGAWVANGRARHLTAAARASRERLGRPIDLYVLHAVDPKTPLATSVRALAKLRDDGVVRRIGLSNIGLLQLEAAIAIAPIDAVEVELSPWKLDAIRGGLVAACTARGIRVLAHRPLGGPAGVRRAQADPVIAAIAARIGATPAQVVLAWLRTLSPMIVTIPGATRIETAISAARGQALVLDDDAREALAARLLALASPAGDVSIGRTAPEIVIVMGMPASGKSTLAEDYVARGYVRLNRDERGGTLIALARQLGQLLAEGATRVVVDNTYASRASRAPVIDVAHRHGARVRCVVLETSMADAQANAVIRILARHGRLLMPGGGPGTPNELARAGEIDPRALFRFRRDHEPPRDDEGFAAIEHVAFARRAPGGGRPALIVELDGVVWRGRPRTPEAIELQPGARDALRAWSADHVLAGTTWQPGLASVAAHGERLAALLELPIHVMHCAHPAGPPVCWCRKPLPGLAFALAHAHALDLTRSLHLGQGPADRGFAARAQLRYADLAAGWPIPPDDAPAPVGPDDAAC